MPLQKGRECRAAVLIEKLSQQLRIGCLRALLIQDAKTADPAS
jgi:hypothetical protein